MYSNKMHARVLGSFSWFIYHTGQMKRDKILFEDISMRYTFLEISKTNSYAIDRYFIVANWQKGFYTNKLSLLWLRHESVMKVIRPVKHKWSTIDCNKNNSRCSSIGVYLPFISCTFFGSYCLFREKFYWCTNMAACVSHQFRIPNLSRLIN